MNVKALFVFGALLLVAGCAKSSTSPLQKHAANASIECRSGYLIRGGTNGAPVDTVCAGDQ